MEVIFVTSNNGKVRNAAAALKPFGIRVRQVSVDLIESRAEDPAEIAMEKAKQAFKLLRKPVIVEDSGFFIESLGGFPMTHIKYSLKTLGTKNILKMLKGIRNRKAEWRMTLAFVYGNGRTKSFTFVEKGVIAKSLRPVKRPMMSDYWRLYVPTMIPGNTKALCEMTDDDLKKWESYFAANNQFMMFGRWYKEHATG